MFFRDMNGSSFVCVDDITGTPEGLNRVIYNPNVDDPVVIPVKLFNDVKEIFGVELSANDIQQLISHDVNHLNEFTNDLRKMIKK